MADVTIEEIVQSAWASAGVPSGRRDVNHVLRLINGKGKNCVIFYPCLTYTLPCTANWRRQTMTNLELARIWIACNLQGVCPRETLWNLACKAFGPHGIGTNKLVYVAWQMTSFC